MKYKIEITKEIHYIEGDRYSAFLHTDKACVPLAVQYRTKLYMQMHRELDELIGALTRLGNEVIIKTKTVPDPNFETEEQAFKYMEEKQ